MTDKQSVDAANYIKAKVPGFTPKVAIVLGSGLGPLADVLTEATSIGYEDIPGYPTNHVAGHEGKMILGYLNKTPVVCLQGRPHFYSGETAATVKTFIRTLKLLG